MLEQRRYPATDRRCDRRGRENNPSTPGDFEDKDFTTFPDMLRLALINSFSFENSLGCSER